MAKDCEVLAVDKGQSLSVACAAGTVLRIAANVLHNAIRYSPPSSEVGLRACGTDAAWIIEVQDHGRASRRRTTRISSSASIVSIRDARARLAA